MVNLIRGRFETEIDLEYIEDLIDFNFLVRDNQINLNSEDLTPSLIVKIMDSINKNIEINIYFKKWNSVIELLMKKYNAKLIKKDNWINISISDLSNLKNISDEDKINWLLEKAKDKEDFLLINESVNKGTITIDNLVKRMVMNNE